MTKYQNVSFIEFTKSGKNKFSRIELIELSQCQYIANVICNGVAADGLQGIEGVTVAEAFNSAVKSVQASTNVTLWSDVFLMVSNGMLTRDDVSQILNSNNVIWNHQIIDI